MYDDRVLVLQYINLSSNMFICHILRPYFFHICFSPADIHPLLVRNSETSVGDGERMHEEEWYLGQISHWQ